jgi:hypothetical protein
MIDRIVDDSQHWDFAKRLATELPYHLSLGVMEMTASSSLWVPRGVQCQVDEQHRNSDQEQGGNIFHDYSSLRCLI